VLPRPFGDVFELAHERLGRHPGRLVEHKLGRGGKAPITEKSWARVAAWFSGDPVRIQVRDTVRLYAEPRGPGQLWRVA